jgi:hypothetical protein
LASNTRTRCLLIDVTINSGPFGCGTSAAAGEDLRSRLRDFASTTEGAPELPAKISPAAIARNAGETLSRTVTERRTLPTPTPVTTTLARYGQALGRARLSVRIRFG